MPYLNPDTIPPIDEVVYRGICVYIPDKPEYYQALLGSLSGLSQWTTWERDEEHKAQQSARLWQLANAMTVATWLDDCSGCGDDMFDCEAMKDCLVEVAKAISVNVTVNNSCGTAGSDTFYCVNDDGTTTINPPPITDEPDIVPMPDGWESTDDGREPATGEPPVGWDTWESYDQDACRAANSMVEYAYQWARRVEDELTQDIYTKTVIIVIIFNILVSGGIAFLFSRSAIIGIADIIARLSIRLEPIGLFFGAIADEIEENRQQLVCMLYESRTSSSSWSNLLIARFLTVTAGMFENENNMSLWEELLYWAFPPSMAANLLLELSSWNDQSNFLSCATCGLLTGAWEFTSISTGYGGTSSVTERVNTVERISYTGTLYKNSTFGGWGVGTDQAITGGTFLDDGEVTVTIIDNSQAGGVNVKIRFERDLGNLLIEQQLPPGTHTFVVPNGHLTQLITVDKAWAYASGDSSRSIDIDVTFEYPYASE